MNGLSYALKKDWFEYRRKHIGLFGIITLICVGLTVYSVALCFPLLLNILADTAPEMLADIDSLSTIMGNILPDDVRGNMGSWASDVCLFYSLVVVLLTFNILPKEIKQGKWIMPLEAGYKRIELVTSKCLVYAIGTAITVFVLSLVYYAALLFSFEHNMSFTDALLISFLIAFTEMAVVVITILLSVICKHSIAGALSVLGVLIVGPDIFSFFSFGKYFPTYLITFLYSDSSNGIEAIVPFLEIIIICIMLYYIANKKVRGR